MSLTRLLGATHIIPGAPPLLSVPQAEISFAAYAFCAFMVRYLGWTRQGLPALTKNFWIYFVVALWAACNLATGKDMKFVEPSKAEWLVIGFFGFGAVFWLTKILIAPTASSNALDDDRPSQ
jgi:hypothetical protein